MSLVELSRLPSHVAIVMDGNGRWAEHLGRERTDGHRLGSDAVRRIVRASRRLGIRTLTLYAFSEQNWARPSAEVGALMLLLSEFLGSERQEMIDNGIRLRAVGRTAKLPGPVREVLESVIRATSGGTAMTLTLALSYGGREEISDAARALAVRVARGELLPEDIDEKSFERELPTMVDGPVDLLVRTGGEQRISNFLLWATAYAELYFSQVLWPDWADEELFAAIAEFQSRDRRFGRAKSDAVLSDERRALGTGSDANV